MRGSVPGGAPRAADGAHATRCAQVREGISAGLDGEPVGLAEPVIDQHLRACAACRGFQESVVGVTRAARVLVEPTVADRSTSIVAALVDDREPRRDVGRWRLITGVAGVVQAAIAMPALLGVMGSDLHLGRELGVLQLALAVGFVLAAVQPRRSHGVAPIAAVVAVAGVVMAGVDVMAGAATLAEETVHLSQLVAVFVLWRLARAVPGAAPSHAVLAAS